jgi:hypothetical protein
MIKNITVVNIVLPIKLLNANSAQQTGPQHRRYLGLEDRTVVACDSPFCFLCIDKKINILKLFEFRFEIKT